MAPKPKKFYTDMASVLIPLATFAGGLTLATQFIIQCPGSRLEALLALASQLFLVAPFVLLSVYLLLYQYDDNEFQEGWQHGLVAGQFCVAGIMLCAGLMLLASALFVAQLGARGIGIWGIVLLSVVVGILVFCGLVISCAPRTKELPFKDHHYSPQGVFCFLVVWVTEVIFVLFLLIFGGRIAERACIARGCSVDNIGNATKKEAAMKCLREQNIGISAPSPIQMFMNVTMVCDGDSYANCLNIPIAVFNGTAL
ncbi:hypothetical protein H2200_008860 [Cladophialophora chaetospira]|uniref:Uncharacterized protein n=1 Tax=Cladophialophora chaetospira TaxID=386627 RepID=A0AA39CG34_9EURO|nr:hypothetical protein H2200_008860 [Cladophialophora chaetospira]